MTEIYNTIRIVDNDCLLYNRYTVHHVTTQNKHQHFSPFAHPAVSFPVTQLIVLAETL